PSMFGSSTSTPDTAKVLVKVFRSNPIGSRRKSWEQPIDQEIAKQKFIASHVPKEDWLPIVDGAAILCEEHQRAITSNWIKSSVQHFCYISKPSGGAGPYEVFAS